MNPINKHLLIITLAASVTFTHQASAAVTPKITYNLGASSFLVASDNSFLSAGDVYVFYGTFATVPTATSTAQEIEDDFRQLGLPTSDPYADWSFTSSVNEAEFEGFQGYLVVSNNSDIGLASEMAIISNSDEWVFNSDLDTPVTPTPIVTSDDAITGVAGAQIIIGAQDTNSGFDTIKLVTLVPEPSSISLLGLGMIIILLRRNK